ncbi:hypothetical protein BDP27DRAFT_1433142 [Rhodocollybia butyracea]|uniref:Uncharacterized protein n=1 Tax=Rhodocollybia butyracea TaxID=206335 RepID=A0A9P5P8N2_9AGAR|nr:hypothetical protein BDP27DRAFT_1433142 [Rhodocollybia butyracea]
MFSLRTLFYTDNGVPDTIRSSLFSTAQDQHTSTENVAVPGAFSLESSTKNSCLVQDNQSSTTLGPFATSTMNVMADSVYDDLFTSLPQLPASSVTGLTSEVASMSIKECAIRPPYASASQPLSPSRSSLSQTSDLACLSIGEGTSQSPHFGPFQVRPLDVPASSQSLNSGDLVPDREASTTLESLETLLAAATLTKDIVDTSAHDKLFSSFKLKGKKEQESVNLLERLGRQFEHHYARIFADSGFATLSTSSQCLRLDEATSWLQEGLESLDNLEKKTRQRGEQEDENMGNQRQQLREQMRGLHARICALYGPIVPEHPIQVDSHYLYDTDISFKDQVNQIIALLTVICNMVIGLSIHQCNFLVGVAILCVQLGMSTISSLGTVLPYEFSPSQNKIIANIPRNLSNALKMFDVDGQFDMYAVCPSCNYTNKAHPLKRKGFYDYPKSCNNTVIREDGPAPCWTNLLKERHDGTVQPIKPYLVSSLPDHLACCLADPTYVEQSKQACDLAFAAAQTGVEPAGTQNVFEANFIKDFKGPDGKLFVDRGDKIRLAFSMHVDFFNPDQYMYMCIVPGPSEPPQDKLDHYIRPVIEQFARAWRPGVKISRTADSESSAIVEAGIILSVFSVVFWTPWNSDELCHWATVYKDARTLKERKKIFDEHGVQWSSFWLLEYWDPTRMLVIDAMHCILEGLVHYHCRHVLRLDASSPILSAHPLQ